MNFWALNSLTKETYLLPVTCPISQIIIFSFILHSLTYNRNSIATKRGSIKRIANKITLIPRIRNYLERDQTQAKQQPQSESRALASQKNFENILLNVRRRIDNNDTSSPCSTAAAQAITLSLEKPKKHTKSKGKKDHIF